MPEEDGEELPACPICGRTAAGLDADPPQMFMVEDLGLVCADCARERFPWMEEEVQYTQEMIRGIQEAQGQ